MWRLSMAWSITIMTDLVCDEVLSVLTHVTSRRTKKGVATIRKLTLRMCCKPFSILRLAQDVKVQSFNYRSLRPAEILVASKECYNPQVFLPPSPLSKTCYRYMVSNKNYLNMGLFKG